MKKERIEVGKIAGEKEWIDGVKSWWASGLQGEAEKSIMAAF